MVSPFSYVLITAVRDEEKTLGETIRSMTAQTHPPMEWMVVSDGSVDRTDSIVETAAKAHSWIKLLRLPRREGRSFAGMVAAINAGVERLSFRDYGFIGLLDGDLRFQPDYFQKILAEFAAAPALGLAGGMVVDVGDDPTAVPRNKADVPGAVQLFRRECYERINGYFPIPEGGFDAVACAHARLLGYKTRLVTDAVVDHLKPRNAAVGGALRRNWQLGQRDHAMGSHPFFQIFKCAVRISERPFFVGGCARLLGYAGNYLRRRPLVVPRQVVDFMRREQLRRFRL